MLVLLVQHDRQDGFRHIAFVAAERPLQRRAAVAALVEVALQDMRVHTVADLPQVAEQLRWTTDAPAALPGPLATAVPRLARTVQHVEQYRALHSAYLKSDALRRAIDEVEALQSSLIAARDRVAARLLGVANTWKRLLTVEYEALQAQAHEAREIPNPFIYGNPVAEAQYNVFTGRQDIVRHIEASILGATQVPTLLLHGPRRMGKTSILMQLPRLLGPGFAPAEVDCQNAAVTESVPTLLRYLSRAMSAGLQRRQTQLEPLARDALAHEPFAVFDEWLDRVEQAMPQAMRLLLCLDEYECLQHTLEAGWGVALLNTLRHTMQHRSRLVLMFTGAHTFAELGPAWTSHFISARRIRVSFLTYDEVLPLLTRPIPDFDMTYAPGALEALYTATHGQPSLTQEVGFELVQYLNQQRRKEATPEAVEVAITRVLQAGDTYFANVWSDAGNAGQAILCTLVRGEALPDTLAALSWLREHDVLNDAGTFAVPMVERWVREHVAK